MELFKGVVRVKHQDSLDFPAGICRFLREKIHHNAVLSAFRGLFLIHFAPSGEQPLQVKGGVMEHQAFKEVVTGLVAPSQNMGHGTARNGKGVGELGLRDILGLQKLQKSAIHISKILFHKYTQVL